MLIGFQFAGVFQPKIPGAAGLLKAAQVAGLVPLLASLGALVAPSTKHILAERLQASRRIATTITRCLDLALMPLGAALALDVWTALRKFTLAGEEWFCFAGGGGHMPSGEAFTNREDRALT